MLGKELDVAILAGGRGSRMGGLTKEQQKCLLVVDGKPVLTHIFDNIIAAFGSANVVLALGYRAEDIKNSYGSRYRNLNLQYVADPQPLETKRRLLLAKDRLSTSFLFLAGDVICHHEQLLKVVEAQKVVQPYSHYGTISGANDHQPALSHALISTYNGRVTQLNFPPPASWGSGELREMHVACYTQNFMALLEAAPEDMLYISKIISQAVAVGCEFQAVPLRGCLVSHR